MKRFLKNNGLSLTFLLLFVIAAAGQVINGFKEHNKDLMEDGVQPISIGQYLHSGHFFQATFENWESEFLQMGLFVLCTIFLYQKGSSESKDPSGKPEEVDREPDKSRKGATWPVRKGGIILFLYKNSLSIAFFLLFLISFVLHWMGSLKNFNEEQLLHHQNTETALQYLGNSRLWFESFQNWQSEFVSVFSMILFPIYLRQKGSPQSKPVDAPNFETGK